LLSQKIRDPWEQFLKNNIYSSSVSDQTRP